MSRTISKKTRFEVFKRDGFACQYCGEKAPDVILHVDHIKPRATGGADDIMNYVTACRGCNLGKGARELDDKSTIARQRQQLEDLNERREQLEMMLSWREGLAKLNEQSAQAVESALVKFYGKGGVRLSESGQREVQKWLKRFSLAEVLDAVEAAGSQYIELEGGCATDASWEKAFSMVPRICNVNRRTEEKPHLKELFYIRGILRNRLYYINEWRCLELLEQAYQAGATTASLREFAKSVRNWTSFVEEMQQFLLEHDDGQD